MKLGLPQWPTAKENEQIFAASIMQKEKLPIQCSSSKSSLNADGEAGGGSTTTMRFSIDVPANGVVAVQVPIGNGGNGSMDAADVIEGLKRNDRLSALAHAEASLKAAEEEIRTLRQLLGQEN